MYQFSYCAVPLPDVPQPIITLPRFPIGGIDYIVSSKKVGYLLLIGNELFVVEEDHFGTRWGSNALEFTTEADYFVLKDGYGNKKIVTWSSQSYPAQRLIMDEVDWRSFWWDVGDIASQGLLYGGLSTGNIIVFGVGGVGEMVVIGNDINNLWSATRPVVEDILAQEDADSNKLQRMLEAARFISEEGIENVLGEFSGLPVPVFPVLSIVKNLREAIRLSP